MTAQISSTPWRTSEADWEPFKARIRQLYFEDNRTLKDVMTIMERDHGFKATSDSNSPSAYVLNLTLSQSEDVQEPHDQVGAGKEEQRT
jgi:hypothetical protein